MNNTIIDVHSHFSPKAYTDTMQKIGVTSVDGFSPTDVWTVEKHLAMMDDHKIASSVLSVPGVRNWPGVDVPALCRAINEEGAGIVGAHPQRFGMDTALPMPDVDASLKELEYALDVLKLDGVCLYTNYDGLYLGDAKFRPLLEEINRRKATVFVHPTEPPNFDKVGLGFPAAMLEYPFDTTRMVTSLVRGGVLKDLPHINWIAAHGGGAVPFLGQQRMPFLMSMQLGIDAKKEGGHSSPSPRDISSQLATLHIELAAATSPQYLLALQNLVPTSNLVMGFDYPYMPEQAIKPAIHGVQSYQKFSDSDKEAVFGKNALALYPRLAPRN